MAEIRNLNEDKEGIEINETGNIYKHKLKFSVHIQIDKMDH